VGGQCRKKKKNGRMAYVAYWKYRGYQKQEPGITWNSSLFPGSHLTLDCIGGFKWNQIYLLVSRALSQFFARKLLNNFERIGIGKPTYVLRALHFEILASSNVFGALVWLFPF